MLPDNLVTALHFARTRWALNFRKWQALQAWQTRCLEHFLRNVLPRAPYYRTLHATRLCDIPTMDKSMLMSEFEARNTRGVHLDEAMAVALQAETSRDFAPMLGSGAGALTVGLSSGTSGNRGVFLVSRAERLRWAGILLGRALPSHLLSRLLSPWAKPLRIAFFLRANSNLYTTLNNRRIHFDFYDLLYGVEPAINRLNAAQPDVLVGPPSLLRALAAQANAGQLRIAPSHVISVAEVLEDTDRAAVRLAFGVDTHQLYQATEGFLGYTCEQGTLHLNETFVHIEPEWLDAARTRFQPIVTDFTRYTQLIVRYRLNDTLRVADRPCPCGRAERAIAAIEGRADEVLWFPRRGDGRGVAIYPDQFRRAMLLAGPSVREFSLEQSGMQLHIGLLVEGARDAAIERVVQELDKVWADMNIMPAQLVVTDWQAPAPGVKRRRILCKQKPLGLTCTF